MFTDLVDSTGIRVRVGEEAAERLRERHDGLVRAAVLNHRGRIVKHTGDGVMAAFSGAADAIAAAVGIQQEMAADNRRRKASAAGDALAVRIGISVGDVSLVGEDCFGLPIIEAQRLESAARPGQILISALVSALARGRGGHELRSVGALELKGLETPLEAQEVIWAPLIPEAVVLPPALLERGGLPFAGRIKEAEALAGAFAAAATGATRLMLISGEPGIGKTRLAAQVATMVAQEGGSVLAGRCDEMVGAPYQPFAEALAHQVSQPGGAEMLGSAPGELVRLLPGLASVVVDLAPALSAGPDAQRLALFEAVASWLGAMGAEGPLLLVLDDLHWADAGSLLLLRHLVANQPVPRLLVIGTYRDTDLDRTHPLSGMLGELRRRAEVTRVSLDGLDAGEVAELVSGAAGEDLAEDAMALAMAVQAETGGNPFFVGEVLRHLVESGAIVQTDGRWSAGATTEERLLPEGIREVVGRRISALPEATQAALTTASVIGVDFDLDLLGAVTGTDEDDLIDAMAPALAAHLVSEVGVDRYRFAHALVRQTLHAELSTSRRARMHRSVAQAIESINPADLDAVATELAYHWAEAGPAGAHDQAITYAVRAAELAWSRAAPEEAARWYAQARELLDGADPAYDARLAVRQGEAMALTGAEGWRKTLLDAARAAQALEDLELLVEALCSPHIPLTLHEARPDWVDLEKIGLLEWAISRCGEDERGLWARLSAALATELLHTGEIDRRRQMYEAVTGYLSGLADPLERHRCRLMLARTRMPYSRRKRRLFEDGLADERAVAELAAASRDTETEAWARFYVEIFSLTLGLPGFRLAHEQLAELLARYPHPQLGDIHAMRRMMGALLEGRPSEAEVLAEEVRRWFASHGSPELGDTHRAGGLLQAAREKVGLGTVVGLLRDSPLDTAGRPIAARALLALALAESGQIDEASGLIEERSVNGFGDLPDDGALPVAECAWSEAAALSGQERAASILYDRMLRYSDLHQQTAGWYLGATARYLGLLSDALGRYEDADDWFARAESEHTQVDSPTWLARGLLDWAESRQRRGQIDQARALATKALDAIGDLELNVSRSRAQRILQS